jgi:hypothetical protein
MRVFFTARVRWLRVHWFWPLALLALPGCGLATGGLPGTPMNVDPGPGPHSGAIFCDIEKERHCASQDEIDNSGIKLADGARALVISKSGYIGLDYSAAAQAICGQNKPQAVTYWGKFPDGTPVCLNCSSLEGGVLSAPAICVLECEDLTAPGVVPPTPQVAADCANQAHVSINATEPTFCFEGACTDNGTFLDNFASPRRSPEPVIWTHVDKVTTSGPANSSLTKNNTGTDAFDAGATSQQTIEHDSGYAEFYATGVSTRIFGLSIGDESSDTDSGFTKIDYGLDLFKDGCVYIFEKGVQVPGTVETCSVPHAFTSYSGGEKFRVSVSDNFDGTATISYAMVTAICEAEVECPSFYTSTVKAQYPLRVDTSFHDDGAIIDNAAIVRIR